MPSLKVIIKKMEQIEDEPDFDGWDAWAELKNWFVKQKPISADGLSDWKNVDWDKICDFVFDIFGDDNAEMARYSLTEFGIDPDTRRPFFDEGRCWGCGENNGNHEEWCPNNDAAEQMRAADSAPPYTAEELDIITDPRRNGALQDPPSR